MTMFDFDDTAHPRHHKGWRSQLKGYAVLVRGQSTRTRVFTTLAGAENAVARARERGEWAEMCLVRLVPVPGGRLSWVS